MSLENKITTNKTEELYNKVNLALRSCAGNKNIF